MDTFGLIVHHYTLRFFEAYNLQALIEPKWHNTKRMQLEQRYQII